MYIYIQVYRRKPAPTEPSIHAYNSIRMRMHEEMAADKRRWSRRCVCACVTVCASIYAWMHKRRCRRTFVQMGMPYLGAHMRTLRWNLRLHPYKHKFSYVRRCMHVVIHVPWASRVPLPPRAHTHVRTRTHTCMQSKRTSICTCTHSNIYIPTW
jgi:hypothetical protein